MTDMGGISLLTPKEGDAVFWRKVESGQWYVLVTNNANRHLEVFTEIEESHYSGEANKDFVLLVFFPTVIAFMHKNRISEHDLATHLGMRASQLTGKDILVLTDDAIFAAETNRFFAQLAWKKAV